MYRFLFLVLIAQAYACTDFMLKDAKRNYVCARSMEFGLNLQSTLIIMPGGDDYQSHIKNLPAFDWTQKYAYLGFTALNSSEWIVDGMNEKGLSFGVLWLPDADYPQTDLQNLKNTIPLQDVGAWILGTCQNIEDVKGFLANVTIYPEILPKLNMVPPVHFAIHDASGNSLVVEFVNKRMQLTENPIGVLTNNPSFNWHMNNLRNYISLTPTNIPAETFNGIPVPPMGQGNGMMGLPGDWTPPSRFVKMVLLTQAVEPAKDAASNVNLAFHLLNTVDIPLGVIQTPNKESLEYTQWVLVKDLQNQKIYFRTYDNLTIQSISLQEAITNGQQILNLDDLSVITRLRKKETRLLPVKL